MNNLTICIPTHCIKTETNGQYKGINQIVPSAPSNKLIYHILGDLFNKTKLSIDTKIHIGLDKRIGRKIDEEYEANLKNLSNIYPNLKVIVNESIIDDPIITAPNNFVNLIDSVNTEYYLFWEHDWIFIDNINLFDIIHDMNENKNINWIRFNSMKNNIDIVDFIPLEHKNGIKLNNIDLLPTTQWSNNPYICRTKIFQNWWKTFIYPTYEEGGFVEGPLNVFYKFYVQKQGLEKALKTFGCFLYGKWNDNPTVAHLNGYHVI